MIGEARLRRATLDDVDELFAIHRAAMREYVAQAYGPWDDAWQQTFFRGHFDVDVRKVVLFDGEVAGFFDVLDKGDHLFVSELVIAPGCQRRRQRIAAPDAGRGGGTTAARAAAGTADQPGESAVRAPGVRSLRPTGAPLADGMELPVSSARGRIGR
jgi:hypothetical protein